MRLTSTHNHSVMMMIIIIIPILEIQELKHGEGRARAWGHLAGWKGVRT